MAVTVVVLSGGPGGDLSLTLDAPRLVIGRGEGCDVRLPDPSVSHRHASIRQRGGEHVLVDENSRNGTFMDKVRLPPQTPRVLRSGERVRVGRVWLEVRFEPAVVKGSTAAAAKELALTLVARGLHAQGEEPGPRITVIDGPDQGATLVVGEPGRDYVIGRGKDTDLPLDDSLAARRHVRVSKRGDALLLADLGSPGGFLLDDMQNHGEVLWRPGQVLRIGGTDLGLDYPAAEALAELERSPDERMPDGDVPEPEAPAAEEASAPLPTPSPPDATPTPAPATGRGSSLRSRPADGSGWTGADSLVVLFALGVLALSALGAFLLLGR